MRLCSLILVLLGSILPLLQAAESDRFIDLWPSLAPGESTRSPGTNLPARANESPPATRVGGITQPQLERFDPPINKRSGAAVVICPGGAFNYVVTDKEGSEPARWLNELGVTAFTLRYRTKDNSRRPPWERPLQDGQRAVRLIRAHADAWHLNPDRLGVLGFSAGGQLAARMATQFEEARYDPIDDTDRLSCRPDFALLLYPWDLLDQLTGQLRANVPVSNLTPPTFLVHAHDDGLTSLSSVVFYTAMKEHNLPGELHVFEKGGHGYGLRSVKESNIDTWPRLAEDWLRRRHVLESAAP